MAKMQTEQMTAGRWSAVRTLRGGGSRRVAAFTLIELTIVIGIIVLAMSLILPVLNTLSTNRSLQNAQGLVAAYIAGARADAMRYQQPIGVCVFIDPENQQTTLAEVQFINLPGGPYGLNQGPWDWWQNDMPIDIAGFRNLTVGTYQPYRDPLVLPKNIGMAVYRSPYSSTLVSGDLNSPSVNDTNGQYMLGPIAIDRLQRMGIIMFDELGCITYTAYGIPAAGTTPPNSLAPKILPNNGVPLVADVWYGADICTPTSTNSFYLYDHEQYLRQFTSAHDKFTDADLFYQPSWVPNSPSRQDKAEEEDWIFANGVSLTVNPFDGTLMKAK